MFLVIGTKLHSPLHDPSSEIITTHEFCSSPLSQSWRIRWSCYSGHQYTASVVIQPFVSYCFDVRKIYLWTKRMTLFLVSGQNWAMNQCKLTFVRVYLCTENEAIHYMDFTTEIKVQLAPSLPVHSDGQEATHWRNHRDADHRVEHIVHLPDEVILHHQLSVV